MRQRRLAGAGRAADDDERRCPRFAHRVILAGSRNVPGTFGAYSGRMSRMVSRGRIAPVVAVLLGLVVLGMSR